MTDWYDNLVSNGSDNANVSSPSRSEYLRPFERISTQTAFDGCVWKMAHYLQPIMAKQIQLIEASGVEGAEGMLYQNPYWPTTADQLAERKKQIVFIKI